MLADGFVGWPVNLLTILGLEKRTGSAREGWWGETMDENVHSIVWSSILLNNR